MKNLLAICLMSLSFCNAQTANKQIVKLPSLPGVVYEIGTGDKFESAVTIKNIKTKEEAVIAENKYLESKYGVINVDWQLSENEMFVLNKKYYILIYVEILKKSGVPVSEYVSQYFDISEIFIKK